MEEETALAGNKLPNECTNVAPATVDNIGDTNNNGATDHMLAQQQAVSYTHLTLPTNREV